MLTKGRSSKTRNDDDDQVTPDSTTEPPKVSHSNDFQEGDDVFFHTEEGHNILGTVGQITNARCQVLFGDGTEQWARFDRLKKLSCSFEEEPSPTTSDNNSSSSSSNNVRISFPSREQQQKTDVVCIECKHVKKVSSRKARLFNASSPYKCSRCSNNQPNHKTNIGGTSHSNLNSNSHQTPTFQKKPSIPRQLLKHLSTSESSAHHHQQQQQQQISQTNLNCIGGDIPNRHSFNNSLTSSSSSTSQYLPTSSSLSSSSSSSSLQSPTRPNMLNYRGSPAHSQHHQQHNSIGSTSTNNSSSILNQQSGSMTIKPIRAVHLTNSLKTGTNITPTTTPVPRTNLCFHCGNRTCVYDRVHCNLCQRYCHLSCLPSVTPPALEGDKFWDVMCSKCGTQGECEKGGSKVFSRRRNIQNWQDVVNLIINCLKVKSLGQQYFDFDVEIMPFFDNNIDRLHLPRQYKSASREDRKVNLLAALKNSRFREVHTKQAGSLWALKSDALSPSSSAATTPLPPSSSSTSPMNTKTQKSKINNNMTTAAAASISSNKNNVSNSNDKCRDLYSNHQLRSPTSTTTTTATIIPNHSNNSNGSNTVKKPTISYAQNTNTTSNPTSPSFKSTNRPNNLTLIPHNNNHVVNSSSVSPPALNVSKFNKNTTITTSNPTVHSPPYNASKSCDMSLQNSNVTNNNNNNNFFNTNTGNNSVTVTSFPRVVSKEALLRNPPLMTTNIILSPTKITLSNTSSGLQNKNMGYSNASSSSSSDCDKSKKLIQGQKNESSSTTGVDSRNSPRKSIKLNQSQKDDPDKSKPKSLLSSSVHKISLQQTSDVNALQRLRIRTPTKQDSPSSTTTTTNNNNSNSKSIIETVSKDSQMKKKDITIQSFPSSSSSSSSKTCITRPQSCIPILSPKSDDRKRPHPIESNDVHELNMSNDSTVISLVKNTNNLQTSNTIVVRATKIARMDDPSPPTSTSTTINENNKGSKESRLIRPKLTRSSSLNIKNGKITKNNNKNNNHYNNNNNNNNNDGKQINNIGRLMRNRGKPGKGQLSNSERKDDYDNNNLKVFNPPNGLTDSSPLNMNGYISKLCGNGNSNNSGKVKKTSLNPISQNDILGDAENNQEDEENTTLNTFSTNLLNAALFAGIRIQSLPRGPQTKREMDEEARKVGEYLLAEEFTTKDEEEELNDSNDNDPNGDGNSNSNSNSDNNNDMKRLLSNGWPSLNNYPNTTATNNCKNNNNNDISRNNENHHVQNNFTMKTKNKKTSKRNLDDVDSYDILSVKVSEDGILRYEVIWYEENSSDDEAENMFQNVFPEYEDMDIVEEIEETDGKEENQQHSEKQEKIIKEGNVVKEIVMKDSTIKNSTTTTSSASNLKNGENPTKKMDIDKEKAENNKLRNNNNSNKTIQTTSPTKSKDSSNGKISIKSEEDMEARKSSLGASKSNNNGSIRSSSNSSCVPSTSKCEFPTNNITISYNRKQFPVETRKTASIDDPDEDDQIQILATPKKSKSTSILPVSKNQIQFVDLTDSP